MNHSKCMNPSHAQAKRQVEIVAGLLLASLPPACAYHSSTSCTGLSGTGWAVWRCGAGLVVASVQANVAASWVRVARRAGVAVQLLPAMQHTHRLLPLPRHTTPTHTHPTCYWLPITVHPMVTTHTLFLHRLIFLFLHPYDTRCHGDFGSFQTRVRKRKSIGCTP